MPGRMQAPNLPANLAGWPLHSQAFYTAIHVPLAARWRQRWALLAHLADRLGTSFMVPSGVMSIRACFSSSRAASSAMLFNRAQNS